MRSELSYPRAFFFLVICINSIFLKFVGPLSHLQKLYILFYTLTVNKNTKKLDLMKILNNITRILALI